MEDLPEWEHCCTFPQNCLECQRKRVKVLSEEIKRLEVIIKNLRESHAKSEGSDSKNRIG